MNAINRELIPATDELLNGHVYRGPELYEGLAYWCYVTGKTEDGFHVMLQTSGAREEDICSAFLPWWELKGENDFQKRRYVQQAPDGQKILVIFAGFGGPEGDDMRSPLISERLFFMAKQREREHAAKQTAKR